MKLILENWRRFLNEEKCWKGYSPGAKSGVKTKKGKGGKRVNNCEPIDEEIVADEEELEEKKSAAWQRKAGKNKEGGLNKKGRESYERENPGSDLKAPVSKKQAKKSKGGKAAKRRKSFCARMKGMKKKRTSAKTARDPDSRINKSLRKWDC
jgi:hypothetical protein